MKIKIDKKDIKTDLCLNCKFSKTFVCDRSLFFEIEKYTPFYIEVFETKKDIIKESYKEVLKRHKNGRYFTFNFTPYHCSYYTKECKCDENRCWNFKEVPARKIPRCIKLLGVDITNFIEDIDNKYFIIDFTYMVKNIV